MSIFYNLYQTSYMLICGAIMCCVYDSFGIRLHATK